MKLMLVSCPKCEHEFDASLQFEEHAEHFERLAKEHEELKSNYSQLDLDKHLLQSRYEDSLKLIQDAKEIAKAELESENKAAIQRAYEDGKQAAEIDVEAIRKEAEAKVLSQMKENQQKKAEKAYQEGLLAGESIHQSKYETDMAEKDKQINAMKIQQDRMEAKLADITNKTEKDVELKGEAQELYIEQLLEKHFPNDDVQLIKKGANGHDCTLKINEGKTEGIGSIAFESKDTKEFQERWVAKLHQDMINHNIDFGIIATRATPKNFQHIEWRMDKRILIVQCKESSIIPTAEIIRELIVNEYKVKRISELPDTKQSELYKRILNPSLGMQVRDLFRSYIIAQQLIDDDAKFAQRSRAKHEQLISQQKKQILSIFGAISGDDSKLAENLIGSDEADTHSSNCNPVQLEGASA